MTPEQKEVVKARIEELNKDIKLMVGGADYNKEFAEDLLAVIQSLEDELSFTRRISASRVRRQPGEF